MVGEQQLEPVDQSDVDGFFFSAGTSRNSKNILKGTRAQIWRNVRVT